MQVVNWGHSLAIRLPTAVVEALDLKAGDDIDIVVTDERTVAVSRRSDRDALLARLAEARGRLPEGFIFDDDELEAG